MNGMGDSMSDKVHAALAKDYNFHPEKVGDVRDFLNAIHEFIQYVGTNHYYSDTLNKKIFLLNLDADELMMQNEKLRLEARDAMNEVELALQKKQKPSLDKAQMADLKKRLEDVEAKAKELHARVLQFTGEIRSEYHSKNRGTT